MKDLSQGNKGIKALAKENPALVENRFGYDVPGFDIGGYANIERFLADRPGFNYSRDVLGIEPSKPTPNTFNPEDEVPISDRLAMGYGGAQAGDGTGSAAQTLGFRDVVPGQEIEINARDETPSAYRFYPSEVSKIYSEIKGVPFSPLVAPPKEATFIDSMQPRRIESQLYAKDGTYVNAYADGTGEMGVEDFPEREELVTGPGGERGDKIPAMLSDGEFIFNSSAVRGMGIMAGASPDDEYEQRLMGARKMYEFQKEAEEMAKRYK